MINKTFTILLSGKQKSGKDTIANILVETLPNNFGVVDLARGIRETLSKLKNIPIKDLYDLEKKHLHRKDLIEIGAIGRLINEDLWVNVALSKIQNCNTIITDVRFENEIVSIVNGVKSDTHEVILARVYADEAERIRRGANVEFLNDVSEISLDHIPNDVFDFCVDNSNPDFKSAENFVDEISWYIKSKMVEGSSKYFWWKGHA